MKKIVYLFIMAIFSFFILAYIDEYETLIAPYFSQEKKDKPIIGQRDKEDLKKTLEEYLVFFNKKLSAAYISGEPRNVLRLAIGDALKGEIIEEINHFKKMGKMMDIRVTTLEIEDIKRLPSNGLKVLAREEASVRYIKGDPSDLSPGDYSTIEYGVEYTIHASSTGMIVNNLAPVSLKKAGLE